MTDLLRRTTLLLLLAASLSAAARAELIQPRRYDTIRTRTGTIMGRIVVDAPGEKDIWVLEPGNNIKRPVRRSEIVGIERRQTVEQAYEGVSERAEGNLDLRSEIFEECVEKRLFELALKEAGRMVAEAPLSPLAQRARIEALLHLGRTTEAAQAARSVLTAGAEADLDLLMTAGRALLADGDTEAAVETFQKARGAAGNDAAPLVGVGLALLDAGRLDEAETALAEALRRSPAGYEALLATGRLRMARGDLAAAQEAYLKARELVSQPYKGGRDVRPLVGLGAVAYLEGRLEDARILLQDALNLRPSDPAAFHNLGLVFAASGNKNDAYKYLRWANQPIDALGLAHSALSHMIYNAGSPVEALEHARKAVEVSPDSPYCNYVLAYLEHITGNTEAASESLARTVRLAPESEEALLAEAAVRLSEGAVESAIDLYRQAYGKWQSPAALSGLGLALAAANRLEEAEVELSSVLAKAAPRSPERLDALLGLGYVANLKSLRDESKRYFLLALAEKGDSEYALDALSQLYEQEGRIIDFYGFDGDALPEGWRVNGPYGVEARLEDGRLLLSGVQAHSDGGITEAALTVTAGAFEAAACDFHIENPQGGWEGGMFLQSGAFRVVVACNEEGDLAWRHRDAKRGWLKWTRIDRFPADGMVHVEFKQVPVKWENRTVPGVAVFAEGRECGRAPVGRGLAAAGVRVGAYTSALIGKDVHMEADNLFSVALGGSGR